MVPLVESRPIRLLFLATCTVEQIEQHLGVLFGHLLLLVPAFAPLGVLRPLRRLFNPLDYVPFAFYFALEGHHIAGLAAEHYLRVVFCAVEEATVSFGITGARCLPLKVEESLRVAL